MSGLLGTLDMGNRALQDTNEGVGVDRTQPGQCQQPGILKAADGGGFHLSARSWTPISRHGC